MKQRHSVNTIETLPSADSLSEAEGASQKISTRLAVACLIAIAALTVVFSQGGGNPRADTVEFSWEQPSSGRAAQQAVLSATTAEPAADFSTFVADEEEGCGYDTTIDASPSAATYSVSGIVAFETARSGPLPAAKKYTIKNTGSLPLEVRVCKTATWLSVSPAFVRLNPGQTVNVAVGMTSTAMVSGRYSASLWFESMEAGTKTGNVTATVTAP